MLQALTVCQSYSPMYFTNFDIEVWNDKSHKATRLDFSLVVTNMMPTAKTVEGLTP
jgi:hypothetical protein